MHFVVFIPARYAATRLPGKPLCDIGGKSLIMRVYEQLCVLNTPHSEEGQQQRIPTVKVFVLTDDQRIYDHVIAGGGHVLMTNTQHQSGTERCAEGLLLLNAQGQYPNVVVNVQGDEPFVRAQQIIDLVALFSHPAVPIATLIKPISQTVDLWNINRPKVVIDIHGLARYFSRQAIPYLQNVPPDQWLLRHTYYKHIGIYAYRSDVLLSLAQCHPTPLEQAESLEQLRWLEHGYDIYTRLTYHESPAVDTPEDVVQVLQLLNVNN